MKYVALLRGINVGGNSRVEMSKLKVTFEKLGLTKVKTYINSGNVIFESSNLEPSLIVSRIEEFIQKDFGLIVKVIIRNKDYMLRLNKHLPETWTNDADMRTDIMFLWDEIDSPKILDNITIKPELESMYYIPGALLWNIPRTNISNSHVIKLVGTELYKKMTIRNVNTVRKLADLLQME